MAYNEELANRIRECIQFESSVEEKKMMGGLCFMVDDKMCIGIMKDKIMCRVNPEKIPVFLEQNGVSPMNFTGKTLKGFVFVDESVVRRKDELDFWVHQCLDYNPLAVSSKKKKKVKFQKPVIFRA